ncbi:unnamed protein product [Durusdinium trenchii]|uniref:Uncharacterized protein n=1 Tax=Durusdinium trenchii TaxID=1381693 RepID=A0ABP0RDF5_9DINO
MSLSLSALLLTLPPSLRDLRVDFWWHLLVLWAQVLVAGGLSLGLCFVAWSDHDGLRIGMEQFAFLLTLLAVYVFGVRQLSVQCCGRRNAQYARRRSTMLWGDRGVPWEAPPRLAPPVSELLEDILAKGLAQTGTAVVDATSTCDRNRWMRRVARSVEVLEVVARILLWIHMAVLGTRSLLEQDTNFGLWVFLAALQLRQLRLSACDVPRAALDAALAGLLQYFRTTFAEWPLAAPRRIRCSASAWYCFGRTFDMLCTSAGSPWRCPSCGIL